MLVRDRLNGVTAKLSLAAKLEGGYVVIPHEHCKDIGDLIRGMADRVDFYEQRDRRHPWLARLMYALDLLRA